MGRIFPANCGQWRFFFSNKGPREIGEVSETKAAENYGRQTHFPKTKEVCLERNGRCHLKVTGVLVEWIVAEVHQAGDLDGDLDVKGDLL